MIVFIFEHESIDELYIVNEIVDYLTDTYNEHVETKLYAKDNNKVVAEMTINVLSSLEDMDTALLYIRLKWGWK